MDQTVLARVRIVLVEPAGALNVGAIARVMKNMGLSELVLVNPQCDPLGEDARKMAIHAADILSAARVVSTMPEALQGCQRAIATTARDRSLPTHLEYPKDTLPWLLETPAPAALIFGPEDRGLSNAELNYAQRFVRIPSSDVYPSLNLAQAVAICCYELYQGSANVLNADVTDIEDERLSADVSVGSPRPQRGLPAHSGGVLENPPSPPAPLHLCPSAPVDVLEGYYQQLEALLLKIGYLYPHTAASRMEKFRRLFNRARLDTGEVAMLRGILSQVEWALSQPPVVGDPLLVSRDSEVNQGRDRSAPG